MTQPPYPPYPPQQQPPQWPQQPYQQPMPVYIVPQGPPVMRKASGATAALWCGILGIFLVIPAVVAVITGHVALHELRRNPRLDGRGYAITGLVMGYAVVLIAVVAIARSLNG